MANGWKKCTHWNPWRFWPLLWLFSHCQDREVAANGDMVLAVGQGFVQNLLYREIFVISAKLLVSLVKQIKRAPIWIREFYIFTNFAKFDLILCPRRMSKFQSLKKCNAEIISVFLAGLRKFITKVKILFSVFLKYRAKFRSPFRCLTSLKFLWTFFLYSLSTQRSDCSLSSL